MSEKLNEPTRRGYRIFMANTIKKNKESTLPPPPSPPDPKSAIRFSIKSDEDIVYGSNYKFNADIEVLINNSKKTRIAKKNERKGVKKTPRRQNAWILYRRNKSMNPEFEGIKSSTVSLKIREMWQKEPEEVKEIFSALSRLAEKRHIEQYGKDYKYQPKNLKKPKNRKISKQKPAPPKNKEKGKGKNSYVKLNNCEFFTTTLDYFATSSETIVESPSNNNEKINDIINVDTNSTLNFLPSPAEQNRNDIWQDPMLQFKLNDEYSFVYDFREIDEIKEINEHNETYETEISYGIFS